MGIIRHLGLIDGDAVDALDATDSGTPGGRKSRRDDDTISTRTTQRRCELCGDVPPQGGVEHLVHDACPTGRVRRPENALRGEACWHSAGIGIENNGVEAIFEYLRRAEKHRCPVPGVDELDAGIGGAGQIVGDYSCQHFSTLRLRLRSSASQHAQAFQAFACQHLSTSACQVSRTEKSLNEYLLPWHSLKRTNVSPLYM
jgi:hypothetical protein